jgi:multidrug transporter EmrE-like cation transporter
MGLALVTALMASVVPYTLELSALRRLPAPVFSILLSLEPAFAALFGWLLLDQESGMLRNLAIVLVIAASAGVTLTGRQRPAPGDPADSRQHVGQHHAGPPEPVDAEHAGFRPSTTESMGRVHGY